MALHIQDIAYELGEVAIDLTSTHADFQRLVEKTGISVVYESKHTALDLATKAGCRILDRNSADIGALIYVTQSPTDYLPAGACVLQHRLGLPKSCFVFDLNQGCSGFAQALVVADALLAKLGNVLIVCADTYRRKLRSDDRSTNAVFSDGSAAVLVTTGDSLSLTGHITATFGNLRHLLYQSTSHDENDGKLHMSGGDIWLFARQYVVPQIEGVISQLKSRSLPLKNIFLHQASRLVVSGIANAISRGDLVRENYAMVGNTVSSSIPILMHDYLSEVNQSVSLLSGFGVGLTSVSFALVPTSQLSNA